MLHRWRVVALLLRRMRMVLDGRCLRRRMRRLVLVGMMMLLLNVVLRRWLLELLLLRRLILIGRQGRGLRATTFPFSRRTSRCCGITCFLVLPLLALRRHMVFLATIVANSPRSMWQLLLVQAVGVPGETVGHARAGTVASVL